MGSRVNSNKKPGVYNVETLAEVFRCFICMEKLQDAHLCPHCSKLCCFACIRRWLTEQRSQCPHCRASLHIFELVNCRWVEEVTQNLETLRAAGTEGTASGGGNDDKKDSDERCSEHPGEQLTVYCETCSKCICHRCALWGGVTHASHSFKPIAEVHDQHIQKIKFEILELRRRHSKLDTFVELVEMNIDTVRFGRDEKATETCRAVESMLTRLDNQLKSKILILTARKGLLGQESQKLATLIDEMDLKLNTLSRSELISQSDSMSQKIKEAQVKPLSHLAASSVSAEFKSEIVPQYETGTFVVPQFHRLESKTEAIYSPPLHVHGLCWRLKVYPNGNGIVRGLYLSVFLELTAGLPEPSKYEYRIEMIHQSSRDPRRSVVREFASDFEVGECWGYNRFFRLDLLKEGFLNTVTGSLELRFHVRAPTYYQKCRDLEWYISQLQAIETQYSAQINELRKKKDEDESLNQSIGVLSEVNDECSLPASPLRGLNQAVVPIVRENQHCNEEPIRGSSVSNLNVVSPTNSRTSSNDPPRENDSTGRIDDLISPEESDNDAVSHEPSEDESADDIISGSVSASLLRSGNSRSDSQVAGKSTPRLGLSNTFLRSCSSQTQRFSTPLTLSKRVRRMSHLQDEAGALSPQQPTSDCEEEAIFFETLDLDSSDEAFLWDMPAYRRHVLKSNQRRKRGQDSNSGVDSNSSLLTLLENLKFSPPHNLRYSPLAGPNILETLSTSLNQVLDDSPRESPSIRPQNPVTRNIFSSNQASEDSTPREPPVAQQQHEISMPSTTWTNSPVSSNYFTLESNANQAHQSHNAEQEEKDTQHSQEEK